MFGRTIQDAAVKLVNAALDTPIGGAVVDRVGDVRDAAIRAQDELMAAANLPTAADLERLLARLRQVSQRIEDMEDALETIDSRLSGLTAVPAKLAEIGRRLDEIAEQVDRTEHPVRQ